MTASECSRLNAVALGGRILHGNYEKRASIGYKPEHWAREKEDAVFVIKWTQAVRLEEGCFFYIADTLLKSAHLPVMLDLAVTLKLAAGIEFGRLETAAGSSREAAVSFPLLNVLNDIEEKISSGETIDALDEALRDALDEEPDLRARILSWLMARARSSRVVWYTVHLLRGYSNEHFKRYLLRQLRTKSISEEFLAAAIELRSLQLTPAEIDEIIRIAVEILDALARTYHALEDTLEEKVVSELLDTIAMFGSERQLPIVYSFISRQWTFKIRVRAITALQSLLTRVATSKETEEFVFPRGRNCTR